MKIFNKTKKFYYPPIAPIPSFKRFLNIILLYLKTENQKKLKKDFDYIYLSRTAFLFGFIAKLRSKIYSKNKVVFWVPEYFCYEALLFLNKQQVQIKYYKISHDLGLDFEYIKKNKCLDDDLFLIVNYFGMKNKSLNEFQSLREKTNIWLIEDSAHSITNPERYISHSDFVLFSPHKHFAIPNGSILKINFKNFSESLKTNLILNITKIKYKEELAEINSWNFYFVWILKRIIQKIGYRTKSNYLKKSNKILNVKHKFSPNISNLMINFIKAEYKDTKSIKVIRKRNIRLWVKCFSPYKSCFLIENKNTNYYMLPIKIISDEGLKVCDHFIKIGFPIFKWPDLPPTVIEDDIYETSKIVFEKFIYLPINHSIKQREIEKFVNYSFNYFSDKKMFYLNQASKNYRI